ncbi:MAG: epoxyqueuosine reductase QueH, partial [Enterococcus sp.]|nr:epoxyqueuosine reductase QueH [Enterococcus sp.]
MCLRGEDIINTFDEKILLHSCCGPCSTAVVIRLIEQEKINLDLFFFNPCITDEDEYAKRLENQRKFIDMYNAKLHDDEEPIRVIEGNYNPNAFFKIAKGLENEEEGGKRCELCFAQRLSETARLAKEGGYRGFTSTLSVSPHKSYKLIKEIA